MCLAHKNTHFGIHIKAILQFFVLASVVFLIFFSLDFFVCSTEQATREIFPPLLAAVNLSAERDEESENVWRRF